MLTFEVPLIRVRMGKQVRFADHRPLPFQGKVPVMARTLALAHRIVQAVEAGDLRDFSEAARHMGVSQARVSMLVALTFLSPQIQEAILGGTDDGKGFHTLLKLARLDTWKDQEAKAISAMAGERDWGRTSPIRNPPCDSDPESRPNTSQNGRDQAQKEGESGELQVKRTPRRRPVIPLSA
ncbi:MAG: hypothetical protein H6P99_404 [Holophagaceae bacterium]|nr:hypothetical protein [Holophagaceae bacterium]